MAERGRSEPGAEPRPDAARGPAPGADAHPNTSLAWRAWNAVSRADSETLRRILSPRIVWHATGANPWRGDHVGFDAVLDYLARVGESTETFDAELLEVLASDHRVVMIFRALVARGAQRAEVDYALIARLDGDRVAEVWTLPLDADAIARFWEAAEASEAIRH